MIMLAIPIVLLVLPASFFDQGQSICLSVLLLQTKCPACGITKAVQHAIHFDFIKAWNYNPMVAIVLPLLVYLWFNEVLDLLKKWKSI